MSTPTEAFEQAYDNFLAGADVDTTMLDCAEFMFNAGRESVRKGEPVAVDHSGLIKRIDAAIERVTKGYGLMTIPADPRSDVDLVLSECKALLQAETPPFWAKDFHPAPAVAQAEPVELYPCGFKQLHSMIVEKAAYVALAVVEGEEITESMRATVLDLSKYAVEMSRFFAKQPLYSHHAPAVAQEPVHFRAVLCGEQQDQAFGVVPKVVGFVDKKAAEQFILEKRDFQGWRYSLEPLYTEAPAVAVNEQMLSALRLIEATTLSDRSHEYVKGLAKAAIRAAEAAKKGGV